MSERKCWICGDPADSAEHMVKASDFRAVFGQVNQRSPVYRQSKLERNLPIRGVNTRELKFTPSLCSHCNNARTQPHDHAWARLSAAIREHRPTLVRGSLVPIGQAFGANAEAEMCNVHLYFVKLLGCYAVEYGVPLPISTLAVSVLGGYPHPNVYLDFVVVRSHLNKAAVVVGDIQAVNLGPNTVAAIWFYVVGIAGVCVTYYEPGHPRPVGGFGWHPRDGILNLRTR